jgi:hypothetical protein
VSDDQIPPVAVPVEFLVFAGHKRPGSVLVKMDDVLAGVLAEPLDGFQRRFPVFLSRSQERHSQPFDVYRRRRAALIQPQFASAPFPEGVPLERLRRDAKAVRPEVEHFLAGRSLGVVSLFICLREPRELRALVAHSAGTSSFAQKNPPVSL